MEAAVVSVATGALKPVLEKMGALLGDKYKRFKGVRKDIKSLTHELAAMDAFLMKMSEEEDLDVQDKVWMNEVRELSYDMEDCIDDFMISVHDKDAKPDGFIEKIKYSIMNLGKMKARRQIGNDIHDLKKQITEVSDRNARYKTRQAYTNTKNAVVDPRSLVIFESASNLFGIEKPKAEIIKLLLEKQQLNIVSIVGSGGIGKTTLANLVYQDLKAQFKCQAFITVSRNPDMMIILRTILSQVGNQSYRDTQEGSVQQLIMNINQFLQDKRYFIVVDDVWDVETWDVIKGSFPINNFGSIIITTTRMSNVAHSCCSSFDGHVYNIRHLDIVQSRHLFNRRLFNSEENCPSYLKEASEQILEKCAGLPLAIIAVSGLLASKERVEHLWIKVKDSIGHALERNASVELMMKILSLSYYDLPAHLKTCLLYLSMYKEDSIIEKKELIRRWIGEGFVHKVAGYTTYELGERYFNELLNRSLIEPVKINLCGKLRSCRVLDTVLDFIISKSTEENFVTWANLPKLTVGTQEKVRRLCRYVDLPNLTVGSSKLVLSHVRSLSMSGGCLKTTSLDACRHLRVLHFDHFAHLEKHHFPNIGRFLRLRFLTLRWVRRYKELPEQIGGLGCLEILDIRGTSIRKLPATIVNLRKLVDLLVDSGFIFPDRIAKMQSLEVLKKVRVFQQQFNFLLELGQLKNLRKLVLDFGTLSSDEYTMSVEECKKVIFSSLHNLGTQNLFSLKIMGGDSFLKDPTFPTVLSLLKIRTRWSAIQRVPNWVASHVNLQQLRLKSCGGVQEDLCILGGLPALVILDLNVVLDCSVKRLTVSGGVGFRCLRQFFYHTFDGMGLVFAAGSMPKLQKLQLIFDADATEFLITGSSCDFGIENLPILDALTCNVYSRFEKIVEAAKSAMERAASTHPNKPTLQTKRVYPPCE